MLHWEAACGGGATEGTVRLACSSLAHFPTNSHVRLGASLTLATPPQSTVNSESQFCHQPALPTWSAASPWVLTGLVVLVDFFFDCLVVRVPCSLIFWHLWLFIDVRLVVILFLVVQGSKGFLSTPPSWSELPFLKIFC